MYVSYRDCFQAHDENKRLREKSILLLCSIGLLSIAHSPCALARDNILPCLVVLGRSGTCGLHLL